MILREFQLPRDILNSERLHYVLVAIILLVSFLLGYIHPVHPFDIEDTNIDYLVGHHIVQYGEFPIVGTSSGTIYPFKYSVLYNYMTALFLLLRDDIVFLVIVNCVLQTLSALFVYLLARSLFSKITGLLALLLYCFSTLNLLHAYTVFWSPSIMQPFALLSFVLLVAGYKRRNNLFLFGSVASFVWAVTMHPSVFIIAPTFVYALIFITRKNHHGQHIILGLIGSLVGLLILTHVTSILYAVSEGIIVIETLQQAGARQATYMLSNFVRNIRFFPETLLLSDWPVSLPPIIKWTAILFVGLTGARYIVFQKNETRKISFLFLAGTLLQFIVIVSFFRLDGGELERHSVGVAGLFIIVIAEILIYNLSGSIWFHLGSIAFISFVGGWYGQSLFALYPPGVKHWQLSDHYAHPVIEAMKQELQKISPQAIQSFSIQLYKKEKLNQSFDTSSFWNLLERDFNQKFTVIDDAARYGYSVTNGNEFIFVVCQAYESIKDEQEKCLDVFLKQNVHHKIEKKLYSEKPYSVYAARTL